MSDGKGGFMLRATAARTGCTPPNRGLNELRKRGAVRAQTLLCVLSLLAAVLLLRPAPTGAEAPPELHISATRLIERELQQTGLGSEHQLSGRDAQLFAHFPADVFLRRIPGFSLFRRSPSTVTHPTTQGVSLRGVGPSGASRSVVLLDGVPLNDPFGGWVHWQRISMDSVRSIRVRENWGSSHFSFLGLGSSIGINTLGANHPGGRARLTGGSRGSASGALLLTGESSGATYAGGVEGRSTDGYYIVDAEDRGAIDRRANSRNVLGHASVAIEPDEGKRVFLNANVFGDDRNNGTPYTTNDSRIGLVSFGADTRTGGDALVSARFFLQQGRFSSTFSSQDAERTAETPALDQFDVPADQAGLQLDWSRQLSPSRYVELGGDLLVRRGETNEYFRFIDQRFHRRRVASAEQLAGGAYAQGRWSPGSLVLDGMIRLNAWRTSDAHRFESDLSTGEVVRKERYGSEGEIAPEPRLQATYRLTPALELRTAVIHAARMPTVNELVRPFRVRNDITEANAALDGERLLGYDLELQYRSPALRLGATGFLNRLSDAIANVTLAHGPGFFAPCGQVPEGGRCAQRANLNTAVVGGIELVAEAPIRRRSMLSVSYTYTRSEITDPGRFAELDGKEFAQLPQHQGIVAYSLHGERWQAGVQARYVGRQFEDDLNTLTLRPYFTTDAALQYTIRSGAKLQFAAENLWGTRYQVGKTADGTETVGPPLTLLAGLQLEF